MFCTPTSGRFCVSVCPTHLARSNEPALRRRQFSDFINRGQHIFLAASLNAITESAGVPDGYLKLCYVPVELFHSTRENVIEHRHCRKNIWPPGIKRKLGQNLGCLFLSQAVVHRPVQVIRDLSDLASGDQGTDGD